MKQHIFNRNLLLGVAATCCCLALLSPEPVAGSQFAITGQFMGSKNIDGEQVLLFKLPKSISSQVDNELPTLAVNTVSNSAPQHQLEEERRTSNNHPTTSGSKVLYVPSSTHQSNHLNLNYRTRLLQQPLATPPAAGRLSEPPLSGELSLSLPLIPELEASGSSTGYVYSTLPQLVAPGSHRPAATRLESTLADILSLAESNNNGAVVQAIEQTDISGGSNESVSPTGANSTGNEEQQQQPELTASYVDPSSSVEQQMSHLPRAISGGANLTSIEAQLRQLLLQRQPPDDTSYSNSSAAEALLAYNNNNNNATSQELNQGQEVRSLWQQPPRHHQNHEQASHHNFSAPTLAHHSQQQQEPQQQVPGILGKLASSSPELLLRLRSLLQRAAQYSEPGNRWPHHANSSSSTDSPWDSKEYERNNEDRKYGGGHSKPLLDSFLSSQNLSSHDEIKIPLVVIAMPRIVSLKRNQYGANQARQGASGTSGALWDTRSTSATSPLSTGSTGDGSQAAIATAALRQLLADLSASSNMTQQQAKLAPSSLISYPRPRPSAHYLLLDNEPVPSSAAAAAAPAYHTTGRRQTMAPYARHFSEPAPPSAQQQAYQQQPHESSYHQGVINRSHLAGGHPNNLTSLPSAAAATTTTTPSLAPSTSLNLYPSSGYTSRLQYFEPNNASSLGNHLSSLALSRLFRGAQLGSGNLQHRLTADQLNVEQHLQLPQQQLNVAFNRPGRQPSVTQEGAQVYADASDHSFYYPSADSTPALPLPAFLSYLGAAARQQQQQQQQQPNRSNFNLTTSSQLNSFAENPQVQGQLLHPEQPASALGDELAAAQNRDSLLQLEQRLQKLRPLFRAGATTAAATSSSKLSSNQMLSLMSRASLARRSEDQQDAGWPLATTHRQPAPNPIGLKKSPEMMLMIV